jgi:hypothetical protein
MLRLGPAVLAARGPAARALEEDFYTAATGGAAVSAGSSP